MGTIYSIVSRSLSLKERLGKSGEQIEIGKLLAFLGAKDIEIVGDNDDMMNDHDENGNSTFDKDFVWCDDARGSGSNS